MEQRLQKNKCISLLAKPRQNCALRVSAFSFSVCTEGKKRGHVAEADHQEHSQVWKSWSLLKEKTGKSAL